MMKSVVRPAVDAMRAGGVTRVRVCAFLERGGFVRSCGEPRDQSRARRGRGPLQLVPRRFVCAVRTSLWAGTVVFSLSSCRFTLSAVRVLSWTYSLSLPLSLVHAHSLSLSHAARQHGSGQCAAAAEDCRGHPTVAAISTTPCSSGWGSFVSSSKVGVSAHISGDVLRLLMLRYRQLDAVRRAVLSPSL